MHDVAITVRKPKLDFGQVPRVYLDDSPLKTHFFNALNLLFPDGERFFVKSVHDHADRISDEKLAAEVRAFGAQEGQHARQHESFFDVLDRQGYDVRRPLKRFARLARWANRHLPKSLRLSMTAGAEHYTATLATLVFRHELVARCDPAMRTLIEWHALEEIEHKTVAYDVFARSYRFAYPLRILGFVLASLVIAVWTPIVMRTLLLQDARRRLLTREQFDAARAALRAPREQAFRRDFRNLLVTYLRPGFHPNQQDDQAVLEHARPVVAGLLAEPA